MLCLLIWWSEIVLPSWVWDDAARSPEATHINMSRHANMVSFFSRLFSSLKTLSCPLCEKGESVIKNPENGSRGEWRTSGSLFWCYGFSLRKRERRDWSAAPRVDQSQAGPCTFQHAVRMCRGLFTRSVIKIRTTHLNKTPSYWFKWDIHDYYPTISNAHAQTEYGPYTFLYVQIFSVLCCQLLL